ncbi:MAG: UDP-2,3-diacylglucosamine diphosphatase LpxI [Rhizobiales bacterium]|nr:UDP-2,3-diacylglucosamine diphosphatase LpxI [Hyphomicrobiales bacterium]
MTGPENLENNTLAIVAGGGEIPVRFAESVAATGRKILVIAIDGEADDEIQVWPHIVWKLGALGQLFSTLRKHNCSELVMLGYVPRPQFRDLHLDVSGLKYIPKILRILVGGDGSVLDKLVKYIEREGITIRGAHEISSGLCLSEKFLGSVKPNKVLKEDIKFGTRMSRTFGEFDVGQGVVVDRGRILAVEAVEGTDRMLSRCADLRSEKGNTRSGVLVKLPKPGQDLRVDMPTIGVKTIQGIAAAGLAGIAVERGHTLVVDKEGVTKAANEAGVFVTTVAPLQD